MLDRQRLRAFVLGGVVGAVAGIVFAPRSGRELRGSVANRAGEARERGREAYFEAQERLQERLSEQRQGFGNRSEANLGGDTVPETASPAPPRDAGEPPSGGVPRGGPHSISTDTEELREKIRATRNRLRSRLGGPEEDEVR